MPIWNDLLLRLNQSDNGTYPNRPGSPYQSPDIIPYGVAPIDNWQKFFTDNYGSDVGQNPVVNQDNFIYSRAKNLAATAATGDYYGYWSPASALMWPKEWSGNVMTTAQGADHVVFPSTLPNGIAVCSEPLKWKPSRLGPNDHYCLVGRVVTAAHPNPIPNVMKLPDFAQYIRDNPNMCWRNVTLIEGAQPTTIYNVNYDQGTEAGMMIVQIAGTFLPVAPQGWRPAQVAFNCSAPGPTPLMLLNPTPITGTTQDFGLHTFVPASFKAPVTVSFWSNNLPIDDKFNLDFQYYYAPPMTTAFAHLHERGYTHPHEHYGISAELMHRVREDMQQRNMLDRNMPPRLVRVGGYTIRKTMLMK
jgi:hypothetical protein